MVWDYVSSVMKDPETLRADLDRMIEIERRGMRGDPGNEAKLWAEKLAEVDQKRSRYQEMAAGDLISFDELRARLTELQETRETAERELAALRSRQEYLLGLERGRDAMIESLEATAPEALDSLSPEERHQFYKLLRLTVAVGADGTPEVSWAGATASDSVCETATLSRPEAL
jgi:hypothetical protein